MPAVSVRFLPHIEPCPTAVPRFKALARAISGGAAAQPILTAPPAPVLASQLLMIEQ